MVMPESDLYHISNVDIDIKDEKGKMLIVDILHKLNQLHLLAKGNKEAKTAIKIIVQNILHLDYLSHGK